MEMLATRFILIRVGGREKAFVCPQAPEHCFTWGCKSPGESSRPQFQLNFTIDAQNRKEEENSQNSVTKQQVEKLAYLLIFPQKRDDRERKVHLKAYKNISP